jgi:hypothetical protein
LDHIVALEDRSVDRDACGCAAAEPSVRGNRELDLRGVRIGEAEDGESGLMRKSHAGAPMRLSPKDRFPIRGEWIGMRMDEAIDATGDALEAAAIDHTGERPPGDARVGRQPGGYEAVVFGGKLQEGVEVARWHVKMLP